MSVLDSHIPTKLNHYIFEYQFSHVEEERNLPLDTKSNDDDKEEAEPTAPKAPPTVIRRTLTSPLKPPPSLQKLTTPKKEKVETTPTQDAPEETSDEDETSPSSPTPLRRSSRESKKPSRFWIVGEEHSQVAQEWRMEYALMVDTVATDGPGGPNISTPKTYHKASSSPEWMKATQSEYDTLMDNQTWTLESLPPNRKAIGSKWTYRLKQNADRSIAKYKVRLVAKRYTQREGIDYTETFAPVAKFTTIRTMLATTTLKGNDVNQMDVSTAYLHADIKTELYMEQPVGFEIRSPEGNKLVCCLKKSIYGLKQAGRNWNKLLDSWLKDNQLIPSHSDPCLYIRQDPKNGHEIIIVIYVDDILITDNCPSLRESLTADMARRFKLTILGKAKWILGMRVTYLADRIRLDQEKYLIDVLRKHGMADAKPTITPILAPDKRDRESDAPTDREEYASLVGSLIYLSVVTHPDIAYAVSVSGRAMANPKAGDLIVAKRILRYLRGSQDRGITYRKNGDKEIHCFADADYAADLETRRSTSGYVFTLAGAAISWASKRQHSVALSTMESEYMAACAAMQELIYLRLMMVDIGLPPPGPTILHQDNQSAIGLERDSISNKRSKHINVRYHFIRDHIARGDATPQYTSSEDMVADCLTKAVGRQVLDRALQKLFGSSD